MIMPGKVLVLAIVFLALIGGGAMYYLQVYAYYEEIPDGDVFLTSVVTQQPEVIAVSDFSAIDADSSPLRYRACFESTLSLASLSEAYVPFENAVPRVAPGWFECFDAEAIAGALDSGQALALLGEKNVAFGVDRVVVITSAGRGYAWHELNNCGEKAYDGTIVGEECPKRAE